MPRIDDKKKIRSLLESDKEWSAYALGDLGETLFPLCQWFQCGSSIALLFKGFDAPLFFALGETAQIADILEEISAERKLYLSVRTPTMDLLRLQFEIEDEELMQRMTLKRPAMQAQTARCIRLDLSHVPAIRALYIDGTARSEAPQFFEPYMVEHGVFFGVFEQDELIAVAGTHLVASDESVAAIGCVYTKLAHRGTGLSTVVTSAVVDELTERGIKIIALNVKRSNRAAIKVYERLGFEHHCDFFEGTALRRS